MKKIKLIALVLAAVMLLSMIPMTAGAADVRHPIVKDVVEFDGQYTSSDSYFAIDRTLYDNEGNHILTLGAEDEIIYTLTDHCMITLVSNAGGLDLENLGESLEGLEMAIQVWDLDSNEITIKSVFEENYPYVLPYDGGDYTSVVYVDFVGLLFDPDADFENIDELPIYGYDILDKYGDVIYSERGKKVAVNTGNGVFVETVMISATESKTSVLIVDETGVKRTTFDYDVVDMTELGDVMLVDMIIGEDTYGCYGVCDIDGKTIVPMAYDYIIVTDEYYIAYDMDEETYEYTSSHVYDRMGELVYETGDPVTYYNGKVAVVETVDSLELEGEKFEYNIMNLIDLSTGDIIVDAENIYCEGGYILAESTMARPYGTSLYSTDGEYIGGKDGWVVCIDEGNSTIILEDDDAEKIYRVNTDMEVVETLSYDNNYTTSYNNVSVAMTYGEDDMSACLWYKGQKISDDHMMAQDVIDMDGCDVFVFVNYYDGEPIATAYIISDDKSPFYDINEDHWARVYIDECFNAGIMNGTGGGKFSPSGAVSRAQVVTTLWRLAGEPEPEGENKFVDVQNVLWYSTAVTWAAENGITTGVGGDYFAPNRTVTRGEVAAILYRYAEYAGDDVTAKADLSTFADADELSDWNRDAFAWCATEGIITGKTAGESSPVRLAPSDALTRAEIAAVLCRYGV